MCVYMYIYENLTFICTVLILVYVYIYLYIYIHIAYTNIHPIGCWEFHGSMFSIGVGILMKMQK